MDQVRSDVRDGVAVVTLDRPERRNALTADMADELVAVLRQIEDTPEVGALVLRGEGETFCAGADLGTLDEVVADPLGEPHFTDIERIYDAFVRFGDVGVPTIAAVTGAAVGAGLNLALAADLRIVASDVRLLSGFLRIGLHPGGGHFRLLTRVAGAEAASAIGLFGQEVDGRRAVELGLAWMHVPSDEVVPTAVDIARKVAGEPGLMRRAARAFRTQSREPLSWSTAVQVERSPQLWSFKRKSQGS